MIGCLNCIGWVCLSIKPHTHGAHVGIKMHNMDTWRQNSNWCIVNVAKVTFILHRDGKIENWGFLTNWMANLKKRNWHGQFKKSVQRTPIPNATISLTNSRHTNLYICMVIRTHSHTHTHANTHTGKGWSKAWVNPAATSQKLMLASQWRLQMSDLQARLLCHLQLAYT